MKDPETPDEWQEAVDLAKTLLAIHDARLYGLIAGGPEVDANRALDLLAKGRARGIEPRPDCVKRTLPAFL